MRVSKLKYVKACRVVSDFLRTPLGQALMRRAGRQAERYPVLQFIPPQGCKNPEPKDTAYSS